MTKTERLEAAGQLRLPNIDVVVDRFFLGVMVITKVVKEAVEVAKEVVAEAVEVVKEAVEVVPVVRHLAAVIKATRTMITARVGGDLLTLGGELRSEYTQETVEDVVDGLNEDDTYTALIGLGFEERMHFAH